MATARRRWNDDGMHSITDIHDLIITGGGGSVVEVATVARLHGLHPMVVPAVPARVDLLHRPLRVWDGDRELRARAIVIAHEHGPLPEVFRDYLAHDRRGRLVTESGSRTNVDGVFAAGPSSANDLLTWLGETEAAFVAHELAA